MKKVGYWISGLGLSTGAAATVLFVLNLAVWSILTAMLGGSLALIGFGLIIWALYPLRGQPIAVEVEEQDEIDVRVAKTA